MYVPEKAFFFRYEEMESDIFCLAVSAVTPLAEKSVPVQAFGGFSTHDWGWLNDLVGSDVFEPDMINQEDIQRRFKMWLQACERSMDWLKPV